MTHSETIVPLDVTMCPIHSVSDALQSGLGVNIGSNLIESWDDIYEAFFGFKWE